MKNVVVKKAGRKGKGVFAARDFRKGEIVYDCAINNSYDTRQECLCGAKKCRGTYPRSFFRLNKNLQRKYLPYLDTWFKKLYRKELAKVKQP